MTLLGVLGAVLAFLTGLWGASYLQDRETRRRHLGIIRALNAEVRRVRRESGGQGKHYIPVTVLGMRAAVPRLSPWVPNILTDVASTSPEVVEKFLLLEMYLDNLKSMDSAQGPVQEQVAVAKAKTAEAEAKYEKTGLEHIGERLVEVAMAQRAEEGAEDTARAADDFAAIAYRHVQTSIEELGQLLDRLEATLQAGPFTHLPWRRL